ncbi:hypothetical protein KSS87_008191 [Heliosperma pusillum]|nr:hypothetical protein KSS87_008191 [Heliosperma pusillum]
MIEYVARRNLGRERKVLIKGNVKLSKFSRNGVGLFGWAKIGSFLFRKVSRAAIQGIKRSIHAHKWSHQGVNLIAASWLVSTTHASLAVTLSLLSVQDWSCPVCPYASQSTLKQKQTLAITVGYLIYDSVCSHFDERSTSNLDNIIHHLVSIIGLGAGLAYQKCGAEMAATIFITEISSPFLHLRELLKELGYKDTDLNLAADVLFALIFSVARMIGGPYLAYVTLTADNPLLIKTMASGLQLVSAFWFYKILRMVKNKFTKRATVKKLA